MDIVYPAKLENFWMTKLATTHVLLPYMDIMVFASLHALLGHTQMALYA